MAMVSPPQSAWEEAQVNLKKFIKKQKELDDLYNQSLDSELLSITTPFTVGEVVVKKKEKEKSQ